MLDPCPHFNQYGSATPRIRTVIIYQKEGDFSKKCWLTLLGGLAKCAGGRVGRGGMTSPRGRGGCCSWCGCIVAIGGIPISGIPNGTPGRPIGGRWPNQDMVRVSTGLYCSGWVLEQNQKENEVLLIGISWLYSCTGLLPVFRIYDILVWIRIPIRGSMSLTNGSG